MQIAKISIQRSTIVVVLFTILTLLGIFSYTQMSYELLPKFSPNVLTVTTVYPGAAPSEVESSVTQKIEDAIASLEGIKLMRSTSMESVSIITIELEEGTDVDISLQDAQRKVNAILADLPDDADPPSLGKFSLDDMPIIQMGAYSSLTATEFYDLMDQRVQPKLSQIEGVAQVNLLGGSEREIKVNLNRNKLEAYGISPLQVNMVISSANLDFPTGRIKNQEEQILIRLAGKFSSVEEIGELVVTHKDGTPIKIKDVAEVLDSSKDEEIISRLDGKSAIALTIQKQSDANAVEVSERVQVALTELEETFQASDLKFEISQDASTFTLQAANDVLFDLGLAIVLVAIIMLLFLHSFRNAVIVMIAVPASIVATFTVMYMAGFTLNLMSLLALSLVVGILVDDAIVVIENIYRHMEKGKSAIQASYDGVREIGGTVVSITLVIAVVFVPIALTGGIISGILTQFSITVAVATLFSLLVAFTLIPLLTSRFSKLEHLNTSTPYGKVINGFERGLDSFVRWLKGILNWAFKHKAITLILTIVLFFSSFLLITQGFIGSEFVNEGDRGEFIIRLELPKDATLEQTNFKTREVEEFLNNYPEVIGTFTTIGQTSGMLTGSTSSPYAAEIMVKMVDKKQRTLTAPEFAKQMEIALQENIVGPEFTAVPVSMMGNANEAPIEIVLSGPNLDTLNSFSKKVMEEIEAVQGTSNLETSHEEGNPEIRIEVDRTKMAELGLSMDIVGGTLQIAFNGNTDTKYRDGDYEYDINVRMDEFDRRSSADIEAITFINNRGEIIQLSQFAKTIQSEGPGKLERMNRIGSITLKSQVSGRPTGTVGEEIKQRLSQLEVPNEVTISYEGDMKMQEEGFGSLGLALIASILLIYLIMVALYDSYVHPFVVMFSLPLALIGALLALALTGSTMSIFSVLGLIMLMGLVAKNAILLVDFTNQLKDVGMKTQDALLKAVEIRFRPILMTTLAMVFGMLPIALASGAGAEWKNGMAWAIIGGLISSMFLTMVIVPVIYYIFDRIMVKLGKDKKEKIVIEDTDLAAMESEAAEYA